MPAIRDIIRGKTKRKPQKSALVCVDAANYRKYLSDNNIRIDWLEFRQLMESLYTEVMLFYYDGTITRSWFKHKHPDSTDAQLSKAKKKQKRFFQKLRELNYQVVQKPIAQIYRAETNDYDYKCNFDVEITMDVMENLEKFDVFVLCSGDGDFINLAKRLKRKYHKEIHVSAVEGRFNSHLKETVTSYDYLNNLLVWVQKLRQVKKPWRSYNK
jgi:uncharacterized LabA/DUF88 family protein